MMAADANAQGQPLLADHASRQRLAALLRASAPHEAGLIADPETELHAIQIAALPRATIVRVYHSGDFDAEVFHLGCSPDGAVFRLTGQPQQFCALGRASGVRLTDASMALAYARAWLDLTDDHEELFYLVASVDEARFLPEASEDEERQIDAFRRAFASVITTPTVIEVSDRAEFRITLHAIREQTLEEHAVMVRTDGTVDDHMRVLATDLPTVYSRGRED